LIKEEIKDGPKGQVVIPRAMRKALKIEQGSKVTFTLEDDKAILESLLLTPWLCFERWLKAVNLFPK